MIPYEFDSILQRERFQSLVSFFGEGKVPNSAGVNLERPGGASPTFEPRLGGNESFETDVYIGRVEVGVPKRCMIYNIYISWFKVMS